MTQRETDAADVTQDLLAIASSALEAIRDYSRYLRNAETQGCRKWRTSSICSWRKIRPALRIVKAC